MLIYSIPANVCFRLVQIQMFSTSRLAFLRFIDICTVAIKNIKDMHVVSSSQIADILHFNDNSNYKIVILFIRL